MSDKNFVHTYAFFFFVLNIIGFLQNGISYLFDGLATFGPLYLSLLGLVGEFIVPGGSNGSEYLADIAINFIAFHQLNIIALLLTLLFMFKAEVDSNNRYD